MRLPAAEVRCRRASLPFSSLLVAGEIRHDREEGVPQALKRGSPLGP